MANFEIETLHCCGCTWRLWFRRIAHRAALLLGIATILEACLPPHALATLIADCSGQIVREPRSRSR
jgi:hypothetical protein